MKPDPEDVCGLSRLPEKAEAFRVDAPVRVEPLSASPAEWAPVEWPADSAS